MKVYDLDGNLISWKMGGTSSKDNRAKSSLHLQARELLTTIYPTITFIEEVTLPLRRGQNGFLDFYCPLLKTAVEVHGSQHYEFSTLFHSNAQSFLKQKQRDSEKALWCETNCINLIVLPYNRIDEWENLLRNS